MTHVPELGQAPHRGITQPAAPGQVLDEQGQFRPRHAADDYADIAKRMRGRWIPKREEVNP